jgi:pimeloyl-ACP methyl ester carboxylesterase
MRRVQAVMLHGIGTQEPNGAWDAGFSLKLRQTPGVDVVVRQVTWGDLIEQAVWPTRLQIEAALGRHFGAPRRFLWSYAADALVYLRDQQVVAEAIMRVHAAINAADAPVVVVAHSWGTVLALDALRSLPQHNVAGFVTMGSPIALLSAAPAVPPLAVSNWRNLYDTLDPISAPLQPLGLRYNAKDHVVSTVSWLERLRPVSGPIRAHTGYWTSKQALQHVQQVCRTVAL